MYRRREHWASAVCALICGLFLALSATPAQATEPETWHGFHLTVPAGWENASGEFNTGTMASPDGIPSRASLLRSPAGTRVLVAFVDARAIALGMADQTLAELVDSYLDAYGLSRSHPVAKSEPWECTLDVPELVAIHGLRAETRSIERDAAAGPDPAGPTLYVCAARAQRRGGLVVVHGWADKDSTLDAAATAAEVALAAARVGFDESMSRVPPVD